VVAGTHLQQGGGEACADHSNGCVENFETCEVLEEEERSAESVPCSGRA
jgi:hypothetical protein